MLIIIHLFLPALPFAPPPINVTGPITELTTWLIGLLSIVAVFYFVIDLFKHVTQSPRDLRAIGIDVLTMAIVIGVATQASKIVTWATTLFS